jgi:hypothetical protein
MSHQSKRSEYEAVTSGHEEDVSLAPRHSLATPTINSQYDAMSMHSSTPLNPNPQAGSTYPPPPLPSTSSHGQVHVQFPQETPGPQPTRPGFPQVSSSSTSGHTSRNPSWDVLGGYRKFESSYEAFDSRNASEAHLAFADGDTPKNAVRAHCH